LCLPLPYWLVCKPRKSLSKKFSAFSARSRRSLAFTLHHCGAELWLLSPLNTLKSIKITPNRERRAVARRRSRCGRVESGRDCSTAFAVELREKGRANPLSRAEVSILGRKRSVPAGRAAGFECLRECGFRSPRLMGIGISPRRTLSPVRFQGSLDLLCSCSFFNPCRRV